MTPVLECKALTKNYSAKQALSSVNLTVEKGRIVGLLGPNGSGKTTMIKIAGGLLTPSSGELLIDGMRPGTASKELVSYLPDRSCLSEWMRVRDILDFFKDFYQNFNKEKAMEMLSRLDISPSERFKSMSKGTKEKVQLILVMSREAGLYLLDEPIGGVDPAARDYILNTIITNYNENASVIISTHLIADIERVLDDVIFLSKGKVELTSPVDQIREERGMTVDALFREVYKC